MAIVIYSARTGRIRRIIFDEVLTDAQLLVNLPAEVGESAELNVPIFNTLGEWQAEITIRTGITPVNDRYVVVDPSNDHQVEAVYLLDPDCGDSIENRVLVVSDVADVGSRQMPDGSFQRAVPRIDHDITSVTSALAMYNSNNWRQRMVAKGMTQPEINQEKARLIAEADAELALLATELTNRKGLRS